MIFNVTDVVRTVARRDPDAPALVHGMPGAGRRPIDYATLDRILDSIAARLLATGLRAGASIDVPTRDAFDLLLLRLGTARAGMSSFQGMRDAGADAALIRSGHVLPECGMPVFFDSSWWSDEALASGRAVSIPPAGGAAVFAVLRTSGSTGHPREVVVTHEMMRARWLADFADGLPARARMLCPSGPGGGVGMGFTLRVLQGAGTVVVPEEEDDLAALVDAHRVNSFLGSPSSVSRLMRGRDAAAGPFPSLEHVGLTGARVSSALAGTVRARACGNLWCEYGATEVGPVSFGSLAAMGDRPGAAGYLLPGIDVEALDEQGRPLPRGRTGLLRMRGPGMAHAYEGDAEATARHFRDGWFVPGDVGAVLADGVLVIEGRNDDLINLGGSKFAPELFEDALLGVPGVVEAAAFPIRHPNGSSGVGAAIVAGDQVGVPELEASFRRHQLPVPSVVMRVPRLPRTESGKVLRRELAALASARLPAAQRGRGS